MWTTERENFSNTSIVVCSSAPSLSGRCAIGRGSYDVNVVLRLSLLHDRVDQRACDEQQQHGEHLRDVRIACGAWTLDSRDTPIVTWHRVMQPR